MKKNILLLCGGKSSEHEVSIRSGNSIYQALNKDKYNVITVGIQRDGRWRLFENAEELFSHKNLNDIDNRFDLALLDYNGSGQLLVKSHNEASFKPFSKIDCVFPVLHGPNGEDGTIQGLFEIANIPYVGCDVPSSALCMDKATIKDLFAYHGIAQTPHVVIHQHTKDPVNFIEQHLDYPVFVKPANMGSSVGISKASDAEALRQALVKAFRFDFKLVVEASVENMHEVESSVLGNTEILASSALGEVVAGHEFYDYETKYIDNESELIIPAKLPQATIDAARDLAIKSYQLAGCLGLARVDMFIDKSDHSKIYINEINTLPGFTSISMYPKIWQAGGLEYPDLIDKLIELGIEQHSRNATLSTDVN